LGGEEQVDVAEDEEQDEGCSWVWYEGAAGVDCVWIEKFVAVAGTGCSETCIVQWLETVVKKSLSPLRRQHS